MAHERGESWHVDSQRLGRLVDRHASALELYARQWCEAPEDVVQEAFRGAVEPATRAREPGGLAVPGRFGTGRSTPAPRLGGDGDTKPRRR